MQIQRIGLYGLILLMGAGWVGSAEAQANANPELLAGRVTSAGRPRLFFQKDGLEKLKAQIRTTHREQWARLKAAMEKTLNDAPPPYREPEVGGDPSRPGTFNDEMLWQRQFGYRIPGMALVALLDPDPRYFEAVRRWALTPGQYPLWGAGIYENTGLAAKHQLFGISIAYDWLYDRWSAEDRASLRETLRKHGRILYEAAEGINDRGWWKDTWRQNHAWNAYQALAVTAITLAGEEPDAGTWLVKALWGGHNIVAELPDEGAYEEGLPYWGYGMEALVRFMAAVRPFSDEDFFRYPYFRNTSLFRLYLAGPDVKEIANFGDGRTTDWHAIRPMMYRFASEYRSSLTQWLAESLPEREDLDATCWSLLWYDPSVPAGQPTREPLSHAFTETGFAGARTSWDTGATTLHLRSGRANVSHSHLDVNDFLLNADGEWLLRDYGYGEVGEGYFNKRTIYFSTGTWGHNCLVIGERHQRLDQASEGRITDAVDNGDLVWWRSDATPCYDGAESVVRELILVRPRPQRAGRGWVIVRDRATMRESTSFDFMLQPGGKVTTASGGQFSIEGAKVRLNGRVLVPSGITMTLEEGIGGNVNVDDPLSLRISSQNRGKEMEFLVVLVPQDRAQENLPIRVENGVIRVGEMEVRLPSDGKTVPELIR